MPECRLTRRVFDWDHTLATRGRRLWNKDVNDIFAQCNIPEAFDCDCWHRYPTDLIIGLVNRQLTEQAHLERRTAGAMFTDLQWKPAFVRQRVAVIRYWCRLRQICPSVALQGGFLTGITHLQHEGGGCGIKTWTTFLPNAIFQKHSTVTVGTGTLLTWS